MNLDYFNPWWKDGKISESLTGRRRKIFHEVMEYTSKRQIILLTGLRRVGKTTLMYQIIDELLKKGTNAYDILYYSFDEIRHDLDDIIRQYEINVLKNNLSERKVFLFFDEIQKLEGWPSKIKLLYDRYPSVKIILSGSAQIKLWKDTRESLAGRFFDFVVKPLDFGEFLDFKKINIDQTRETLFEKELKWNMDAYLATGGFIEALDFDEQMLRRYMRESLLERVLFVDVPQAFRLDRPDLLFRIMSVAAAKPGIYLDYRSLGNDLDVDQRTIASYVSYLEYALFCQKLYNYSKNLLTSEKKMKRLYLSNTAFTLALNPKIEMPLVFEQYYINMLGARFFLRTPQKDEIDIIHVSEEGVLPVEIKIRQKIDNNDLKPLYRFMVKHGLHMALLISKDEEKLFANGNLKINAIPYWRYWTIIDSLPPKTPGSGLYF